MLYTEQRDAITEARRVHAALDRDGYVHVYGPKLYGDLLADEMLCTPERPFTDASSAVVIFHVKVRPLGWTGSHVCTSCGCNPCGDEPS